MASTYSNLGIELIGTGEQAGTWGITTNTNLNAIIDNAIVGYRAVAITGTSSGAPTVLTISDGSASDGQKRILEATGTPASAGFLQISPNDFAGYYFIRNSTTQTLNVFQGTYSSGNAVTIESGYDAIIRCNGGGVSAVVSFINYNIKTGPIFVTNSASVGSVIEGSTSAAALRITQTGAGNALLVEDSANPDSTPFVIDAGGAVGMGGTTVPAGSNFYNAKTLTGSTNAYSNRTVATVQSDVTSNARGYTTSIGVVAAHPTLSGLQHFLVTQASFNGSTVTSQIGYYANASLVGATNNYAFSADDLSATTGTAYGFYSNSNISGTGTAYNFYAAGTAPNVFTGTVNIGTTGAAGSNFLNAKTITGATTASANNTFATVQSDVTAQARGYVTNLSTAASAFTLTALRHFYANQATIGAGSTVSSQIGFYSEQNLIGATNNYGFAAGDTAAVTAGKTTYGFHSSVNTATGGGTAYGFYAAGTAPNVFVGTVNIGSNGVAGTNFYNAKNITGATTANACAVAAVVQSDVTVVARGYSSLIATAAASFSTGIQHFYASQSSIGAGSTVTTQYGFFSESNLIGATNNYGFFANNTAAVTASKTAYGFYSGVNAATGGGTTYSFYSAGTAPNVFTGTVNIGSTGLAGANFYNAKTITGATTAYANVTSAIVQSDVTGSARAYSTFIGTAAASFTLSNLQHFLAQQGTIGAGSTVTSQTGFSSAANLIDATSNIGFFANDTAAVTSLKTAYGFYSAVNTATGGGTTWGFYAAGTANNYFGGNVAIGRATPTVSLDVNGAMALRAPSTVNAAAYTVAATDSSLRFTTTNCTVTLPAAASFTGRILYLNTITANSVTSASSNVIPLGSNTAGTAIFAATAGKFAMIQSDGTNWITMMAN